MSQTSDKVRKFKIINGGKKDFSLKKIISLLISSGLLIYVIGYFQDLSISMHDLQKDIQDLKENSVTKENIELINSKLSLYTENFNKEFLKLATQNDELEDEINNLKINMGILQANGVTQLNNVQDNLRNAASNMCNSDDLSSSKIPLCNSFDVIAIDYETNEKQLASEYTGKTLLFTYQENGKDILFCGQFSENNRWDKTCITNVYENGKLCLVTEANYEDGLLIDYRQAYSYIDSSGKNVWSVSKRKCLDDGNFGDSFIYYKNGDITQNFTAENVSTNNLYTVKGLTDTFDTIKMAGFYHGYTSNGKYNDLTGEAYLIKFSEIDGTVRTLYLGCFKDGNFSDDSGKAWYITRDDKTIGSKYMYYIGRFENGNTVDPPTPKNSNTNLTYEDITKYTSLNFFKCELYWYGVSSM